MAFYNAYKSAYVQVLFFIEEKNNLIPVSGLNLNFIFVNR